jgi:hypothetical protein
MPDRPPHIEDCPHCKHLGSECSYCDGTGKLTLDWYYGMDQKVYRLGEQIVGESWNGHDANPEFTSVIMPKGSLVKVVMCSRFGDVGITDDLDTEHGYLARIDPEILRPVNAENGSLP